VLKRLTWWALGVVAGAGGSSWLRRRVRRRMAASSAARAVAAVRERPAEAVSQVRAAVEEGRRAARQREDELRDRWKLS